MKKSAFIFAALMAGAAAPSVAQASCASLWSERNQIYKDAGYCFKTARAIRAFGNAGCSYDDINDVPLSARQRAAVRDIVAEERRMGCGD
ncbi:YARHG domain-containing protein [Methylocystis parvus]|uniref:YARHG domain-containing protein n=1 Tax=Methylocystis parvus TaxID=134 RepID=A0A6B8M2D4_9HYPH|nr:YARHG domain-containing protein [Methylocystis parvus]QGM96518.1 YARHG domain-containing protein [Methylocystis parvus]WBJ99631.1 YARHG domain-containing protein [Methylocystis parvus OBBP]